MGDTGCDIWGKGGVCRRINQTCSEASASTRKAKRKELFPSAAASFSARRRERESRAPHAIKSCPTRVLFPASTWPITKRLSWFEGGANASRAAASRAAVSRAAFTAAARSVSAFAAASVAAASLDSAFLSGATAFVTAAFVTAAFVTAVFVTEAFVTAFVTAAFVSANLPLPSHRFALPHRRCS